MDTEVKEKNIEEDINSINNIDDESQDELVVADMSLVRKRSTFLPERIRHEDRLAQDSSLVGGKNDYANNPAALSSRTTADPRGENGGSVYGELTPEETKWALFGTLKAALMVGAAYAVGLGLIILIMVLVFS